MGGRGGSNLHHGREVKEEAPLGRHDDCIGMCVYEGEVSPVYREWPVFHHTLGVLAEARTELVAGGEAALEDAVGGEVEHALRVVQAHVRGGVVVVCGCDGSVGWGGERSEPI